METESRSKREKASEERRGEEGRENKRSKDRLEGETDFCEIQCAFVSTGSPRPVYDFFHPMNL